MTNGNITTDDLPSSQWQKRLAVLKNMGPLFRMVWESSPRVVTASLSCRLIAALVPLAMLAVTRTIIDSIYDLASHHTPLSHYFWWLVGAEFALAALGTMLARLLDFCDTVLADGYSRYISTRTMEHAAKLDLSYYEDPAFYDKLERARVQGTDRIGMIQSSGLLVQQVITTVSLAVSIFVFSPWILLVLVCCMVPAFLGETHFAFLGYSLNFAQTAERRELDYLRVLGGSKESAKELKLFGLGSFFVHRYRTVSDKLHLQNVSLAKQKLIVGGLLTIVGTVGYYGAYSFAIYQTVLGLLTLGTLTFLTGAIAGASSNIQAVFTTFSGIADQALFLTDLLEFFNTQPKIVSKLNALPAPRPIRRGFEFKNVSFAYPGSSKYVLRNVSFRLAPSESIALVGKNGQGKTTIVKLLTRLYEVTSGQILLDGIDIREYDLEDYWREVGVIFQDFMRYEMTANDNIAVGRIEDRDNMFRVRGAALKSRASDVVRKLHGGYDQVLGSRFEGAVDLSGGEWQKMALARAYLRDAQLLILDEPTASLDPEAEHDIFERFTELTRGKMALLISHRMSTVKMADRVLVLENGSIAEQGPHTELIRKGGSYAELFEMQAASYR